MPTNPECKLGLVSPNYKHLVENWRSLIDKLTTHQLGPAWMKALVESTVRATCAKTRGDMIGRAAELEYL